MSEHDRTTADEYVLLTPRERRHRFETMIGASRHDRPGLWLALDRLLVAYSDARDDEIEQRIGELADHFPRIKPAMLAVWERMKDVASTPGSRS